MNHKKLRILDFVDECGMDSLGVDLECQWRGWHKDIVLSKFNHV